MLSPDDRRKLRRHHNATIGLFVALWLYALVVVGVIEFLEVSQVTQDGMLGVLFGGAIVVSLLQFTQRCPSCRANLGRQVRLGVPRRCGKCGAILREEDAP